MDCSSTNHYLHKKFKKQLSFDQRPHQNQNDKENNASSRLEPNEEKSSEIRCQDECQSEEKALCDERISVNQNQLDNNKYRVPNQSTNPHNSSFSLNSIFSKSSISLEIREVAAHTTTFANQQPPNPSISYVAPSHIDEHVPTSFDMKFCEEPTNFSASVSSILDESYPKHSYVSSESHYYQQYYPYNIQDFSQKPTSDEPLESKLEEVQSLPDKNSNGKYVCPYCNLVCSKPSVLQKHIRAHTNERPYPCKSCGFSFKTRSNLYKHCRSRTHANRVMGIKTQESNSELAESLDKEEATSSKPYKPRFHTSQEYLEHVSKENIEEEPTNRHPASEMLSQHINEIINKNNCIVNDSFMKRRTNEDTNIESKFNQNETVYINNFPEPRSFDEPLNLTNKNRKRSLSEVTEPIIQKSLIKELLLKNLSASPSDMQCPHCKMIFQTVTELDVHKYRSCKGKPAGTKYARSSSVNVASILTQNKNAFDNIPHLQNFSLNSPGPFLGKTRLVDSDKSKSFSFDNCNLPIASPSESVQNYLLSPLPFEKDKKGLKLFGGEVKIHSLGETKSFKIDGKDEKFCSESSYIGYGENRVIKSSLQSGGTVLTNKKNYDKHDTQVSQEVIRVYENTLVSPNIDISNFTKPNFAIDRPTEIPEVPIQPILPIVSETQQIFMPEPNISYKYTNIMDFSQKAVQKMTPNLIQPVFTTAKSDINPNRKPEMIVNSLPMSLPANVDLEPKKQFFPAQNKLYYETKSSTPTNLYNPLKLIIDGRVVRHVPGMPGPVVADTPMDINGVSGSIIAIGKNGLTPLSPLVIEKTLVTPITPVTPRSNNYLLSENVGERNNSASEDRTDFSLKPPSDAKIQVRVPEIKSSDSKAVEVETRKFARPNSLALKPSTASLKQHHGLTPTKFNQILISPDTPRVDKKYAELYLHGNYFSYLGLKSSTKPVYCTLNKTQPFYVHHFKKLSMYSEWRQQDTRQDKLYVSNYDSRQRTGRYSIAGKTTANLIMHSSYKFMVSELPTSKLEKDDLQKNNVLGGYECNDDYTYIRGRGRGRYVCDQCGIRCKKPSMLKKHIKTHSNDRPYTCSHCNFSFKTKGNLTKHMKSKAHTKNYTASSSSGSSTQQSAHSSDSDTEDSGMDSSDESTRQQEHEAAYGLLSLSQKPTPSGLLQSTSDLQHLRSSSPNELLMTSEEIAYVSKNNYAKNKILDEKNSLNFTSKSLADVTIVTTVQESSESRNVTNFLGKSSVRRPLTYPYTSELIHDNETLPCPKAVEVIQKSPIFDHILEPKSIKQFHVIQKYMPQAETSPKMPEIPVKEDSPRKIEQPYPVPENNVLNNKINISPSHNRVLPTLKLNDVVISTENVNDLRKRKFMAVEIPYKSKIHRNDGVMDLSMATVHEKLDGVKGDDDRSINNVPRLMEPQKNIANEIYNTLQKTTSPQRNYDYNEDDDEQFSYKSNDSTNNNGTVIILRPLTSEDQINVNYSDRQCNTEDQTKVNDYDNSAMETLADIATKQVKLEKNMLAKSVATEYLKLATKHENLDSCRETGTFSTTGKDMNNIIVKSEGNKSCTVCSKSFNKPSQLRLHMNIHYLERPFRCDSCSVSFRTKGHLQKHERSAGHHNKLSSSPALSTSEPRPFKCSDCNIAFRIHGHLAKHLRSKMHIMKLECLAKIPFGLYAELERSNSLLTEINTCDGDQCLESLKTLAKKVFIKDPSKLNNLELTENLSADC